MRKHAVLALALTASVATLAASPAAAQGNWQPGDFGSARVRLGLFMPDGDSQYWHDTEASFTGSVDDFEDLTLGFDYVWKFNGHSGLIFSTSFYQGETTRAYRDYVDDQGNEIRHANELDTADLTAAWLVQAGGHNSPVRPYFGLGGGFLFWNLSEEGWWINFADPGLPIVDAGYADDGTTLEGIALAGIEFGMSRSFSFLVEGRYRWAEDELGGDFAGAGTLDLSGFEASAGFGWNF